MGEWERAEQLARQLSNVSQAHWLYDDDPDLFPEGILMPCCSQLTSDGRMCQNGPLTGEQILIGNCGEHGTKG